MPPELLGLAMFRPGQAAELLRAYPGELGLAWEAGRAVGVVGYRLDGCQATILHIAVDPVWRRRGVGRTLVAWVAARAGAVVAETDGAALEFYRRCGFAVEAAPPQGDTPRYAVRLAGGGGLSPR